MKPLAVQTLVASGAGIGEGAGPDLPPRPQAAGGGEEGRTTCRVPAGPRFPVIAMSSPPPSSQGWTLPLPLRGPALGKGCGQGCIGRGAGTTPPPPGRPAYGPANVSLTASASFTGICNRQ